MCGIFGMIGGGAVSNTLRALKYLEYRGYDSAGIAVKGDGGLKIYKTEGRIQNLVDIVPQGLQGGTAIGHTRWATHGAVCAENAHPFYSPDRNFAVVHNGIIENYLTLKEELISQGAEFSSATDSETVAHLLMREYNGDVLEAVQKTAKQLSGSFAIVIATTYDQRLFAVKRRSPLVVGIGNGGVYLCSDIRCVSRWAEQVAVTPDNTIVVTGSDGVYFYDYEGNAVQVDFFDAEEVEEMEQVKGEFMIKEIYEIPERIRLAKREYMRSGLQLNAETVRKFKRIYLIGCGTAYNSGLQVAAVARKLLDIDVLPVIASEFIYDNYPVDSKTLAFFISQSGETADTIRACEKVKEQGGCTYAVTNTKSSQLAYACDRTADISAGGEFAVASTKAYNCQLITLLLLMLDVAKIRGTLDVELYDRVVAAVDELPEAIDNILNDSYDIARLADEVKDCSAVFFIGRTTDYPTAAEGSLKLKEISYIHSEAYPAGELKHGTLALMEEGVGVVAIATDGDLKEKMALSIKEVVARGAKVICVSPYKFENAIPLAIPAVDKLLIGVVAVVPLQLLAYYTAKRLGRDVDKPRNLAKSVTVE
ncbi:MAG: glutamine--fructose-6-phosphate transaminase (isomerizing) [Clostridiales bacterium]|nr:glutamine--fructose-6-phosphate transaminase (isomerizing) [Clostridiales bacterium]